MKTIIQTIPLALLFLFTLTGTATAQTTGQQPHNNMDRVEKGQQTFLEMFGHKNFPAYEKDPELMEILDNFIFGEIYHFNDMLTDRERELINMVVFTTNQNYGEITEHTRVALRLGVTPVEIKEAIYQCSPYVGFPKALEALGYVNQVLEEQGIKLPLPSQKQVTEDTRYEEGLKVQVQFFGEQMRQAKQNAPEGQKHIQDYLSAMCFGDFYTRSGLDLKTRELLTFCIISSLGGAEPQVKAHVNGNLNAGNDKNKLIAALTQCLPYIGFPRMLNAIACVNEIAK